MWNLDEHFVVAAISSATSFQQCHSHANVKTFLEQHFATGPHNPKNYNCHYNNLPILYITAIQLYFRVGQIVGRLCPAGRTFPCTVALILDLQLIQSATTSTFLFNTTHKITVTEPAGF